MKKRLFQILIFCFCFLIPLSCFTASASTIKTEQGYCPIATAKYQFNYEGDYSNFTKINMYPSSLPDSDPLRNTHYMTDPNTAVASFISLQFSYGLPSTSQPALRVGSEYKVEFTLWKYSAAQWIVDDSGHIDDWDMVRVFYGTQEISDFQIDYIGLPSTTFCTGYVGWHYSFTFKPLLADQRFSLTFEDESLGADFPIGSRCHVGVSNMCYSTSYESDEDVTNSITQNTNNILSRLGSFFSSVVSFFKNIGKFLSSVIADTLKQLYLFAAVYAFFAQLLWQIPPIIQVTFSAVISVTILYLILGRQQGG